MSRLTKRIEQATAEGRKALIPYLPAGYPEAGAFWKAMAELDAGGADVIEIGVPFSDPVADGPVVEEASLRCLDAGMDLAWIFRELKKRRASFSAEFVLMGYLNPFLQYGLERLMTDAAAAGVAGFIVPDLPLEEADAFQDAARAKGLDLIFLVGLNTSTERLAAYAKRAMGFVYVVSVLGITGARDTLPDEVREKLAEAKDIIDVPLALGFGLKSPEQIGPLSPYMDAAVFGSALIKHIKDGGAAAEFMARWR